MQVACRGLQWMDGWLSYCVGGAQVNRQPSCSGRREVRGAEGRVVTGNRAEVYSFTLRSAQERDVRCET
jgi:hypothetical protein